MAQLNEDFLWKNLQEERELNRELVNIIRYALRIETAELEEVLKEGYSEDSMVVAGSLTTIKKYKTAIAKAEARQ